jgi:acyl-CoA thioester hydrolase
MSDPSAGEFRDGAHWLSVRVYHEDTDFTGVVYHANYLRYMERGRSDFLRLAGVDHQGLHAQDATAFAIAHMDIDFKMPARVDDALTVRTEFSAPSGVRLIARQWVMRGQESLAQATVTAVCIGADGKPRKPPRSMVELLTPWFAPS